jgi:hypothetical protein
MESEAMARNDRDRDDRDDYDDRPRRRRSSSSGSGATKVILIIIILGVLFLLALVCGGGLFALLYFSVGKVREAAVKMQATNNLREIGIGVHRYHDAFGTFPPAYLKAKDGQPGLSWRVALLPYIDQDPLYKRFKLDEPWDSPKNLPLLDQMPQCYRDPSDPLGTMTHYRVFVGKNTCFEPGIKVMMARVSDGTSNTLLAVESSDAVPWTKPEEIDYQPGGPLPALGLPKSDFVMVLMVDGSVRLVNKKKCSTASWHNAIQINDGQVLGADFGP